MLHVGLRRPEIRFPKESPKVENFPGLQGYPSHFGIDLAISEVHTVSIVHHVNLLLLALPVEFQSPIWNLLGYISYLSESRTDSSSSSPPTCPPLILPPPSSNTEQSGSYFRAVLRLDPANIVATSNLAESALRQGNTDECQELKQKIEKLLNKPLKNRYIAVAHLDIAIFYFYAGLTSAAMRHLTAAVQLNSSCHISRFYYSLFSYLTNRIDYNPPETYHTPALLYVNLLKPATELTQFLLWVIETKSAFLPRAKTDILTDKLMNAAQHASCPLILLLIAKELYNLECYTDAVECARRSVTAFNSAPGHFLIALCLKHVYDKDTDQCTPQGCVDGNVAGNVQLVVETQHDTKHLSSATMLPVTNLITDTGSVSLMSTSDFRPRPVSRSGRSRMSARKYSPKDQSENGENTEALSETDEDTPLDPKLTEIFDHIRCACILDPYDVTQLLLLTELLILCRRTDVAVVYLHEILSRGTVVSGDQRLDTYLRLVICYLDKKNAEQGAIYLRLYQNNGGEMHETYMNLVVKLADSFIKLRQPLHAKQWLLVMEHHRHPSCEHFTMRLKRLITKDKHLLDAFNMDKTNSSKSKKNPPSRKKVGSSGS